MIIQEFVFLKDQVMETDKSEALIGGEVEPANDNEDDVA